LTTLSLRLLWFTRSPAPYGSTSVDCPTAFVQDHPALYGAASPVGFVGSVKPVQASSTVRYGLDFKHI
jgi:hypothetical protein